MKETMRGTLKNTLTATLKKATILAGLVLILALTFAKGNEVKAEEASKPLYRLYNKNNGEHLFTMSQSERDKLVALTWKYEGIAGYLPSEGTPVYRLYNKNSGEHHYTASVQERDKLVALTWKYEGIAWNYANGENTVPLYRLYNKNAIGQFEAGGHHYTTSVAERDKLVGLGWKYEGIAYYIQNTAQSTVQQPQHVHEWQPVYKTEPVYETKCLSICNVCGKDITGNTDAHDEQHMLAGEGGGYHSEYVQVQTGTQQVLMGYKCDCGATK
jgi:hypothetical protein